MIEVALNTSDFEQIFKLKSRYDFTMDMLSPHYQDMIIECLVQEPHYAEIKLQLLIDVLGRMPADKVQKVLDTFDEIVS